MTTTPETATVACRFCGAPNRFPVERALRDLARVTCGNCQTKLLRVQGEPLNDLHSDDLAHPWDREALAKLRAIPYFEDLLAKLLGSTFDKNEHFKLLAHGVRIGPTQLPRIHALYLEAAGRLDVDPPPLFLLSDPHPNAATVGAGRPLVFITSGLTDLLDDRSLLGVLGHELTHVKLGHVVMRTAAHLLATGALQALNFFGLAKLALTPLKAALAKWAQMSELSADRGELVASGSLETHLRTHMRLAGGSPKLASELDVAAFVDQAHEAQHFVDDNFLVSLFELFAQSERSHPLVVWRVHHAMNWARTQGFFDLLAGVHTPPTRLIP